MKRIPDGTLRLLFQGLVHKVGGVDAAAALCECAIATISKQSNGNMQIVLAHVWALEDAAGHYPVTELRQKSRESHAQEGEIAALSRNALIELGDVPAAILAMAQSGDRDGAVKELTEAIEAASVLRDRIQSEEDGA